MGLAKHYYTSGQRLTEREKAFFGLKPKAIKEKKKRKQIKDMSVDDILKKLL